MSAMNTWPVPGRGAWTLTGGLLPVRPGSHSTSGYYSFAVPDSDEIPVGSAFLNGDTSHNAQVINLAVQAIQKLAGLSGSDVDGWFGAQTAGAVQDMQLRLGVDSDAIVGRATMRAALEQLVKDTAASCGVPEAYLGGVIGNESAFDPGAVGVNGMDHGGAQINLGAHHEVSLSQALDLEFSLLFTGQELAHTHAIWVGKTKADPWDIAIANHNSPALARQWAASGTAPVVSGRLFQIATYVQKVKTAW